MSLPKAQKQILRAALKKRSRLELKTLFATIRGHDDGALLAALAPARKKPKRARDPLLADLALALKPILAPSAEKADMLVEHLAKKHRRKFSFEAKGVADAARRLRAANLTDDEIRAGASALVSLLAKLHGRETVV